MSIHKMRFFEIILQGEKKNRPYSLQGGAAKEVGAAGLGRGTKPRRAAHYEQHRGDRAAKV